MLSSPFSPTGEQFVLDDGRVRVEIGALAAVLREVRVDGVRITETVPENAMPPHGCGIVLAPWPNRVRDARWQLHGETQQLDVTDVGRGGAIHGLLRNTAYRMRDRSERAITLGATIFPQHGWPFRLETWVTYALEADGITVTHGVRNDSGRRAPWAVGAHPYFRVGETPAEQLTLTVAGESYLELDERLNPVAEHPVAGTELDARGGVVIAEVDLNVAYGGLANREARSDIASIAAPDGASTTVWADSAFRWLQVFTPRDFPIEGGVQTAVALEPMTAPPDALNSGTDLVWLEPGAAFESSWGVRYTPAARS